VILKRRANEPLKVQAGSLSGIDKLRLVHVCALMTIFYMQIRLILTYISAFVGFLCKISSQPFIFCMVYAYKHLFRHVLRKCLVQMERVKCIASGFAIRTMLYGISYLQWVRGKKNKFISHLQANTAYMYKHCISKYIYTYAWARAFVCVCVCVCMYVCVCLRVQVSRSPKNQGSQPTVQAFWRDVMYNNLNYLIVIYREKCGTLIFGTEVDLSETHAPYYTASHRRCVTFVLT
jgi:hypothetical protein